MLEINRMTVLYGEAEAVKSVSLKVNENSIVSPIGANGAGKSTILKAISGLVPVKNGQIVFLGKEITNLPPKRIVKMGIAHVPEGRSLFPFLTVIENLTLGAYLRDDSKEIKLDLEEILYLFPRLKEKLHQKAGTLSGGEQQMVAIGRALMARPRLLLMDEPSLGLAPLVIEHFAETIKTIVHARKLSILLAEQNASMVMNISDYCYVLETGRIILEGNPQEIIYSEECKRAFLG